MIKSINKLIDSYQENLENLRELLKLPEKFEKEANIILRKQEEFMLPILISSYESELKKPQISKKIKEKIQEKYDTVIDKYKKISPENITSEGALKINVDEDYRKTISLEKMIKEQVKLKKTISHKIHIEKATLFNLICYLEKLLSDTTHILLSNHPEILALHERTISLEQIIEIGNIADLKNHIITVEIEKMLFKSLNEFLEFFEEKIFRKKMPDIEFLKKDVVEIKERRNLIIHNGGIVNSKYLNIVDLSIIEKFKLKKDIKIPLSKEYLMESIDNIELLGVKILLLVGLKYQDKKETAWQAIRIVYSLIRNKKFNSAEKLSKFILDESCIKNFLDVQKDYSLLNYWLTLKKQGKLELNRKDVIEYDVSSKKHLIQLCYYSLIENYTLAFPHIIPSLRDDEFDEDFYNEFPILESLRKQKKAQDIFKEYQNERKQNKNRSFSQRKMNNDVKENSINMKSNLS
jgi:hypothetical protein